MKNTLCTLLLILLCGITDESKAFMESQCFNPGEFDRYPHGIRLIDKEPDYVPRLIPLKENDTNYEPLSIYAPLVDPPASIKLHCQIKFDEDFSDTTKMIKPVYIEVFSLFDGNEYIVTQLYTVEKLKSLPINTVLLWYELTEKFINWLYAQPFSQFYNRGNPEMPFNLHGGEVFGISLYFNIEVYPEIEKKYGSDIL